MLLLPSPGYHTTAPPHHRTSFFLYSTSNFKNQKLHYAFKSPSTLSRSTTDIDASSVHTPFQAPPTAFNPSTKRSLKLTMSSKRPTDPHDAKIEDLRKRNGDLGDDNDNLTAEVSKLKKKLRHGQHAERQERQPQAIRRLSIQEQEDSRGSGQERSHRGRCHRTCHR